MWVWYRTGEAIRANGDRPRLARREGRRRRALASLDCPLLTILIAGRLHAAERVWPAAAAAVRSDQAEPDHLCSRRRAAQPEPRGGRGDGDSGLADVV